MKMRVYFMKEFMAMLWTLKGTDSLVLASSSHTCFTKLM